MKKVFTIISVAALLLLAFSCKKNGYEIPEKYKVAEELSVKGSAHVEFGAAGGSQSLSVLHNSEAVTVKADAEWVNVSASDQNVIISCDENFALTYRYAQVTISSSGKSCSIQVKQNGVTNEYLWEESYSFAAAGGEVALKYLPTTLSIKLKVEGSEWITAAATDNTLKILAAKNETGEARTGKVTWQAGEDIREIVITQAKGNGGGGDEPGEVTYASWIGSWSSSAGTLVISELSEADHIYLMSFEQFGEQNVPAFFNEETGALEFYAYEIGTEGNWTYWFCSVDSENYIETGGPNDDIMLASATLNAAKTAFTIKGNEYTAVYNGTPYDEVIVKLVVAGYLSEKEGDKSVGWYSFNNMEPVDLPAAYIKAGTTSVKNTPLVLAPKYGISSIKQFQTR
jgi:hypothetical protein